MLIKNTQEMEKAAVKNLSLHKKNSEEDVGRHPTSVSVENVEKLTIRTKNGLVNGVAEEKCKSSKKQVHAKPNVGTNITKESKKSKKGHSSGIQNNEINVSNSNIQKKNNSQKNKKIEPSNTKNCNTKNCVTNTETSSEESKVLASSLPLKDSCSIEQDLNKAEVNQLKPSQSESKLNEPPSNKTESKRKKNKSKLNKTEPNMQIEQSDFNLPKFDIASIINASVSNENLLSKVPLVSETPSSSQLDINKSYLLEYQDSSSEFEKDLIESIKNLKIQQQDSVAMETTNLDNASETNREGEDTALLQQEENLCDITYVQYESELQMPMIMRIIQKDLSEPYSIYTYRYFIHNWPKLCFLAMCEEKCVGAIVCKLDFHRKSTKRGYIAMLAVDKDYRKRRIGSTLVRRAITEMIAGGADEVVLETEVTNKPALRLYEQLGFVRDKRLFRYYLNGVDALRLKLWLR